MKIRMAVFFALFVVLVDINQALASDCLEGWVYDAETGYEIEGVNIIIEDSNASGVVINTVTTSPNGHYTICPSEPGVKHLLTWAPGFSPQRQIVQIPEQRELNFHLLKAGTIMGSVVNDSNQPIEGAQVLLEYIQKVSFPLVAKTLSGVLQSKNDGRFVLKNIEAFRTLRMTVTHPDYSPFVSAEMTLQSGQELTVLIVLRQ